MNEIQKQRTSKFLSLVLRHEPEAIGIQLDVNGWVEVKVLLAALAAHGRGLTRDALEEIVETNDKRRFAFSEDGQHIRANQGHSVQVELGYQPQVPPEFLFHGTASRFLESIRASGLRKGERHHVHLSLDEVTAHKVGSRHGKPVILKVRAQAMHEAGHPFYLADNGVWLADAVPVEYLEFTRVSSLPVETASRNARSSIAAETVRICEEGVYVTPEATVSIAETVARSKAGTKICRLGDVTRMSGQDAKTKITVTEETTLAALQRLSAESGRSLAALNFASARNPGGGFLGGAQAQEESLARSSCLYPSLLMAEAYYEANRAHRSALYLDLAIWSPGVAFFRDDGGRLLPAPFTAGVITAPAPNAGAVAQNSPWELDQVEPVLRRRADFVLALAQSQGVQRLVLGAWGCGVFRNDPKMVAKAFSDLLHGPYAGCFEEVVFAVHDRTKDREVWQAFASLGEVINVVPPGS